MESNNIPGSYARRAHVFTSDQLYEQSDFISPVRVYNEDLLLEGQAIPGSDYLQLPQDLVHKLAEIAEQHISFAASDFEKAIALENFLRTEFVYEYRDR
ncbi:MAG: hypothetical protein QGG54_19540, partial [Gammaproteobacteria bacterium]|nr:hypothetical protein [Gammaproteobacteria bacterium]